MIDDNRNDKNWIHLSSPSLLALHLLRLQRPLLALRNPDSHVHTHNYWDKEEWHVTRQEHHPLILRHRQRTTPGAHRPLAGHGDVRREGREVRRRDGCARERGREDCREAGEGGNGCGSCVDEQEGIVFVRV